MNKKNQRRSLLAIILVFAGAGGCDEISEDRLRDSQADELQEEDALAEQEPHASATKLEDASEPSAAPSCTDFGPVNCYWSSAGGEQGSGNWLWKATCDTGFHVYSGGCHSELSGTRMVRSNPFENNDSNDLPEHDECAIDTDGVTGWACEWAQSGTGDVFARALCCIHQ